MRKHIFGFAIFSLIIFSFAMAFAFFYAPPIPRKEEVKQPVIQKDKPSEKPTYCVKRTKDITYQVESSQFYLETGKLISKIKLTWNGSGEPPKKIYLNTHLFTLNQNKDEKILDSEISYNPFVNGNEATILIELNGAKANWINGKNNLYVVFDFSTDYSSGNYIEESRKLAEAKQVLFVYGENSVVKKAVR